MAAPGPSGLAVVRVPPRGASVDRYLLGALGISGGASEGSSSGGSELVSSLSGGFNELLVSERSPPAMANLVICATAKHELPIYESMERAVAQYEAVKVIYIVEAPVHQGHEGHLAIGRPLPLP
jgi:hypothetical protein